MPETLDRIHIDKAERVYLTMHGQHGRIAKKRALKLIPFRPLVDEIGSALFIRCGTGQPLSTKAPPPRPSKIRERAARQELQRKPIGDVRWISVQELIGVWQKSPFGGMRPPSKNWGVQSLMSLDSEYAVLTMAQADQIIRETEVEDIVWSKEKTDCDNISRYFAARVAVVYGLNCVAVVDAIDEGHSYNAFLLHDGDQVSLRGFEPQTDQWRDDVEPRQGWIHFG